MVDWKHRSTQVCKPCWELKYCPYGPFVEQSPLLPTTRDVAIAHNEHLKKVLQAGHIGEIVQLTEEEVAQMKELLEAAKRDPSVISSDVARDLCLSEVMKLAEEEGKDLFEYLRPPTSELEKYRVPHPLDGAEPLPEIDGQLKQAIDEELRRMEETVRTGKKDQREPLNASRRKSFEASVNGFNANDYPESIPEIVLDTQCKNFGHVCPVVFVGEAITETTEKRRRGRYIPFATKIRVVRRDNYTCQHCSAHLKDDEVEFDHIIPHAKGGSSEEHNIRLTCFKCNRDKSDSVDI